MLQDDIILRQIKRLVEAVARLKGFKKDTDPPLHETVDELLEQFSGLKGELLRSLSPTQLVDILSPMGEIRIESAVPCAVMLLELARYADREQDLAPARRSRQQAAALLIAVEATDPESEELVPFLEQLEPLLAKLDGEDDADSSSAPEG